MTHNTKKILQTVAVAGAVTATGAVATTAHADAQTPASANTQQSTSTTSQQQLANLQSQQQASEAAMAANNNAVYNSAASAANQQVAKLNQQLANQQASQAAQDQTTIAQKSAEINQQASQAVASENAAYTTAVKSQMAENQQALNNAAQNIKTPKQIAQQKQAAKESYDSRMQEIAGTHGAAIKNAKNAYETAAKQATDEAKANETQAEQQRTAQIQAATKAVNDATTKVNNLQNTNDANQSKLQAAKNKIDNLNQNSTNKSSDDNLYFDSHEKITLSQEYIDTLNDDDQWPDPSKNPNFYPHKDIKSSADAFLANPNSTTNYNNTDGSNMYYTKMYKDSEGVYLPESSQKMSIYLANLINQLRQQAGHQPVHVSPKYIEYGYELMHIYNHDMSEKQAGNMEHDAQGFQQFAKNHNIIYIGGTINGYGGTTTDSNAKPVTINGITGFPVEGNFELTSDTLMSALFELLVNDGTELYGHARTLIGDQEEHAGWNSSNCVPYLAVNTDKYGDTQIMLFYVAPENVDPSQDLDVSDKAIAVDPSSTDNTAALQQAQADYNTILAAANDSAQQLASAKTELANAQAKLDQLKAGQPISQQDQALQAKLNDLAKTRDAAYQKANDQYKADAQAAKDKYDAQLKQINQEPTSLDQLKATLQTKLDDLKKAHEAKLAQIKQDADQKIAAVKQQLAEQHQAENKQLTDQIAQIKQNLAAKKANLDAQLNTLKANDATAYAALKAKLFPTNTASAAANGKSDSYVTGNNVKVVFPVNVNAQNESTNTGSNSKGELPQTGNENSAAVVALGAITSMLGLGLTAKKREF